MESQRKYAKDNKVKVMATLDALPDSTRVLWTEFDDEMIRKHYPTKGTAIAKALGKTRGAVSNHASKIGVKFGPETAS